MQRIRDELRRARQPAIALITALIIGALLILATDFTHLGQLGRDPVAAVGGALSDLATGYAAMLFGALGDPGRILTALRSGTDQDIAAAIRPLSETLLTATPFIFTGLGLTVSFRAGLFNLGVDGQFLIGGMGASITAMLVAGHLPPIPALMIGILGGAVAGAAYAFVPGILKARTGAHEVITTLMLNGMAMNIAFLIGGMVGFTGRPAIATVPQILDLPSIRVDYGFVVAIAVAAGVSFLLFRTTLGLELRAAGFSRTAAHVAGMRPGRTVVLAMTLSGGLAGMGSAFLVLGPAWGSPGGPENGMGYVSIALALLGGLRASGAVAAALLYGALTTGALNAVVATGIPLALLSVIVALAIIFVAAPDLTRTIWRLRSPTPIAEPSA